MDKASFFALPVITYQQVRALGHLQQMGIYKPKKSAHAYSIITNVGEANANYEDNLGDDLVLNYRGRGQGRDQTLNDYDNRALAQNLLDQVPVRVFAGAENEYRDWGMWLVVDLKTIIDHDGFIKLVYYMVPVLDQETGTPAAAATGVANQNTRYASRIVRQVRQQVRYAPELEKLKRSYNHTCQVDVQHVLPGRKGNKAVVHHLEPVAKGGELVTPNHSNEIVLCPNCHALFDDGSIFIDPADGITLRHYAGHTDYEGKTLRFVNGHVLDRQLLQRVHRLHWGHTQ